MWITETLNFNLQLELSTICQLINGWKSSEPNLIITQPNTLSNYLLESIGTNLSAISESQSEGDRYVWMIGTNPTYFIQYQIDSYAIFKANGKIILVWKPKYLQYPSIVKLAEFGQQPKLIKNMQVVTEQKYGKVETDLQQKISQYIKMYYGMFYFGSQQQRFQKDMITQLKHYVSRVSKENYWHCGIDDHRNIDVTSKKLYIKLRVKGFKQKYDKDIVIFSHQGVRQFLLKGKGFQIVSFLTMLVIFIAVISCSSGTQTGFCSYKDQMILGSAAVMMGMMGMRVASRNKYKKKLDKKISELEKQN